MKLNHFLIFFLFLSITSCNKESNSPEFISKVSGRYLFNSDEVIKVYFKENDMYLDWRGAEQIHPLKINKNTFFVKEMNEKIQFLTNPSDKQDYLVILPKEQNTPLNFIIKKIEENQKIPSEYLKNDKFEKALSAYLLLKEKDSLDPAIAEKHLNSIGYKELRDKNYTTAINYFKVNVALNPKSANVYDSMGDALRKSGDTAQAIVNYKKSLKLDSSNSRVKRKLQKLVKE